MFTRDQIEEIKKKLIMLGTKDTQFPDAHKLNGEEIIAIVQDGENKKIPLSSIINDDFINVSKDTTEILTLSTAVSKIDTNNRKLGQVITFKDSANSWAIRQFTGSSLDNWNDISLWKSISGIDELKSQVETNAEDISVLSDEIERHDASILNLNTDVSELKDKDIETSSSLSELNTKVNTLKSQADTNTSNISSLNTEVSTLQSKVDENTTSISQINNSIADHEESIAQINTKLEEHTESINANITTDRIEDGAVTSEKIATSAFDSTLSVSGKIAPADVVGTKLSKLNEKVDARALGAFYGYFPDSASLPTYVTIPGYAYVGLDNPFNIWNFNGELWSDSGTYIDMNDVDEEDITRNIEGKLQFKDRTYGDGMGYVILRKDKTFAEQVTQANTIYEIRYVFDLEGTEVTIPKGCVLKFEGGSIKSGVINFQTTKLDGIVQFLNCTYTGTIINDTISLEWFNNKEEDITTTLQFLCSLGKHIIIPEGIWLVSDSTTVVSNTVIEGISAEKSILKFADSVKKKGIYIFNNDTSYRWTWINKYNENYQTEGAIKEELLNITIKNITFNCNHDGLTDDEISAIHGACIRFIHARYCTVENCRFLDYQTISQPGIGNFKYTVLFQGSQDCTVKNCYSSHVTFLGFDLSLRCKALNNIGEYSGSTWIETVSGGWHTIDGNKLNESTHNGDSVIGINSIHCNFINNEIIAEEFSEHTKSILTLGHNTDTYMADFAYVNNNILKGNCGQGIFIQRATNVTIVNNIVEGTFYDNNQQIGVFNSALINRPSASYVEQYIIKNNILNNNATMLSKNSYSIALEGNDNAIFVCQSNNINSKNIGIIFNKAKFISIVNNTIVSEDKSCVVQPAVNRVNVEGNVFKASVYMYATSAVINNNLFLGENERSLSLDQIKKIYCTGNEFIKGAITVTEPIAINCSYLTDTKIYEFIIKDNIIDNAYSNEINYYNIEAGTIGELLSSRKRQQKGSIIESNKIIPLTNKEAGTIVIDASTKILKVWNGATWIEFGTKENKYKLNSSDTKTIQTDISPIIFKVNARYSGAIWTIQRIGNNLTILDGSNNILDGTTWLKISCVNGKLVLENTTADKTFDCTIYQLI